MNEITPLLGGSSNGENSDTINSDNRRKALFDFLEAKTPAGKKYQNVIITLIVLNVIAFIVGSLFVQEYNDAPWAQRDALCQNLCDAMFFGNYYDNGLESLHLGTTSILEIVTIAIFSIEYILRLFTCDLEDSKYQGFIGRLRYIPTFFSLVDLASTLPFYIDAFLPDTDIAGSAFLRMFRLLRMMRVEGRYGSAITMCSNVFDSQKEILGTALFIGATTWMTVSSLYYLVERESTDMIYCGAAPDYCPDDIDTSRCTIDKWGIADCTKADCPPTEEYPEPCYNLFQSIPMASFFALLNLFGEFPLIDQHSVGGMVVGTFTAILAAAFFALPASIVASGFQAEIEKRVESNDDDLREEGLLTQGFEADPRRLRGRFYNFLHIQSMPGSHVFDHFINFLVVGTTLSFFVDTLSVLPESFDRALDIFEFIAVIVFTLEYIARLYAWQEDPKFASHGFLGYLTSFLPMVDLLSAVPYWIALSLAGSIFAVESNAVKALRVIRILRFEKYTHAFSSFDNIFWYSRDVLAVTVFAAILFWVFFSAFLYLTERDNPNEEMASNYNTVPNAMWVTLLNLGGEAPLAFYSIPGKIAVGILGLFATAIFGVPIGVLGAGFEAVLEKETSDNTAELENDSEAYPGSLSSTQLEEECYKLSEGIGSGFARVFETCIFILIFTGVGIGVIQTVDGHENDLSQIELFLVIVFTAEYLIRFVGVGANPEFAYGRNAITSRVRYIFSFYSIIDLLAIVPYYLTLALPGSIIDEYDEYLRMVRILRLVKLDKYIPSITLIDDVIRLKWNSLKVAFFAAFSLWIIFSTLLYVFESVDYMNEIDPVPKYGCYSDCTMQDRFQNLFDSLSYTGIHLTGDYPIIEYSWPSRFVNFFMVIAAVGVVTIPSALIASGFVEIVQSKSKARNALEHESSEQENETAVMAGDDWYEVAYRGLENVSPPPSKWGPKVDKWQLAVNEFLNGKKDENGILQFTSLSSISRAFIFMVIIANVIAVLLESIPVIDKRIGNESGNFFDVFEAFSVLIFAAEYLARLFAAPKNREALYSSLVYATTFFGIVDFLSTAPWFVERLLMATGTLTPDSQGAMIFRIFRIFRIFQLEDFFTAFSKLDNVFRASKDILKATGLLAIIIWVGCAALFFIFEENNPNWRECDDTVPLSSNGTDVPGCYDFKSTAECNVYYPGQCDQRVFTNMPNTLYLTAVFLGGEWGVVDFTWPGRLVCLFLCICGIELYAIPIGALFDSFGAVLGMGED